jgi:GDP-6-deoxy-D-talose 4-dehydrogenase
MHVLITGVGGFTGRHLKLKLIESGHTVTGLSANLIDFNSINKEIEKIQPEAVVHLAGVSFTALKDYKDYYDVNLVGSRNLLEALSNHSTNLKSVLIASSASIYGNEYRHAINENDTPNPNNDYAISKLALEYVAKLFMDRLPIFIVRPFNYTGVGQDESFLIPKIVKHFKEKKSCIELGDLNIEREFNDVRNVVNTYANLIKTPPLGEVLNICTEKAYSIKNVVNMCENITQHKLEIKINPIIIRTNVAFRLVGNSQHLKNFIISNNMFSFEDTLSWMLLINSSSSNKGEI